MRANLEASLRLLDRAPSLVNRRIQIREYVSRSRNLGRIDRHFATNTQFSMNVAVVRTPLSGSHLMFDDDDETWYDINLDSIVNFLEHSPYHWEISEYFEQETERRSIIQVIDGDKLS
jgi:hypothetical protein